MKGEKLPAACKHSSSLTQILVNPAFTNESNYPVQQHLVV